MLELAVAVGLVELNEKRVALFRTVRGDYDTFNERGYASALIPLESRLPLQSHTMLP